MFEGSAAAVAFDVHLEDRRVVHEAVDEVTVIAGSGKTLPHSPNGWLAVISSERCWSRALISPSSTLVSAWSLVT